MLCPAMPRLRPITLREINAANRSAVEALRVRLQQLLGRDLSHWL